jgi:hypothetical protein
MWPLRVVVDTNVLTPKHFDIIDKSPMRRLRRIGRVIPIYGNVFLEETLRSYEGEKKREELVHRWMPFVLATVDRFCDDLLNIYQREVVWGRGLKTNIFLSTKKQKRLLERLAKIPADGTWRAWYRSKDAREEEDAKKLAQRETSKEIRREVAEGGKTHAIVSFDKFLAKELDHTGRVFIPVHVKCKYPDAVADRWSKDKMQYPYFTTFICNMAYIAHHAMTKPNDRIDPNAQADLNLMSHLLRADALVSNETGFLVTAFNDLWRPRGKLLFNSEQFVELIEKF